MLCTYSYTCMDFLLRSDHLNYSKLSTSRKRKQNSLPLHQRGVFFSMYQLIKRKYGLSANSSKTTYCDGDYIYMLPL